MRKGLHPLMVHLGMAAANAGPMHEYAAQFQQTHTQAQLTEMVRGIQLYHAHPFTQKRLENETVWKNGTVSVVRPKPTNKEREKGNPVLLVPSLINKPYILDLSEERSLLRWLNNNGINAYLLDWGGLSEEENAEDVTIDFLVQKRLCRAIEAISEMHGKPVDVLGYCMGGTLLVSAYPFAKEHIGRMVFLASPWDFHKRASGNKDDLARAVRIWSPLVLPVIEQKGVLPSSCIQALFASLGADETVRKFARFASTDQNSQKAEFFVSVEDWLNDDVDIPGKVAQECIQSWFLDNAPAKGQWNIEGVLIDPAHIQAESLIIASKNDRLVPYECAVALAHQFAASKSEVLEVSTGHIGLIVGSNAVENVWTPILQWLRR